MINAQGNYQQGRGPDGLGDVIMADTPFDVSRIKYAPSRFGAGTPMGDRPPYITGKMTPPASLDPQQVLPRTYRGVPTIAQLFKVRARPYSSDTGQPAKTTPRPGTRGRRVSDQVNAKRELRRRQRKPTRRALTRYRQNFIKWLQNWAPEIYAASKAKADTVEQTEGTLGQLSGWWETFQDSVADLGGKYLQYRTQKEILDAQLERMKQGLPPLQTSEYAPTVIVKPDPGTTAEITGAIGAGLGRMLPFIAIGGVALLLMMRRR
jgi:hypothetical protein